jgi:hypothetical protein
VALGDDASDVAMPIVGAAALGAQDADAIAATASAIHFTQRMVAATDVLSRPSWRRPKS